MNLPSMDWNRVFEFAWRILVFIVAVGIIIVVSTNWTRWEGGAGWQTTNDAYLQADLTPISAKVTGYVRELPIQDFEHVRKGQVLAQLVDDDYRAAAAQAEAGVATAMAQTQALAAERQLTVLEAQIAQSEAAIAAQRAALDAANLNVGYTTITATQDGVIAQRQVKPGQLVGVGSQITTLTPLPNVWVIANYKETQLTHMAVGQKSEITVDTFPGHTLRGHVLAFAPASGAVFALLPPDNATGNFTKVVQRIAVKIVIDDADGLADRLVPGMSVEAKVNAKDSERR